MELALFEIAITRKPIYGPGYFGRQDDLSSACPVCYAGVRRLSAPVIDYKETQENPILRAGNDVIVIHESLKHLFETIGLSGFVVAKALDSQNRRFPFAYYELTANIELPRMAPTSIYNKEQVCRRCDRGGYTIFSGSQSRQLHYSKDVLRDLKVRIFLELGNFGDRPIGFRGRFTQSKTWSSVLVLRNYSDAKGFG